LSKPLLALLTFRRRLFKVKLNSLITGCEIPLEFMFFSKIAIENEDFKISGEIALTVVFTALWATVYNQISGKIGKSDT